MLNKILVLGSLLLSGCGWDGSIYVNPIYQTTYYKMDKSRSSAYFIDGSIQSKLISYYTGGNTYQMDTKYLFKFDNDFNKSGTDLRSIPAKYFSADFLLTLRSTGQYQADTFKIKHLGFSDIEVGKNKYTHCDKLNFYEIKDSGNLYKMAADATICKGIPIFGIAKLDVVGIYGIIPFKVGFDYMGVNYEMHM